MHGLDYYMGGCQVVARGVTHLIENRKLYAAKHHDESLCTQRWLRAFCLVADVLPLWCAQQAGLT